MIQPILKDDAFLKDVREDLASPHQLRFWWLGQSGFLFKWIDPTPSEGGLRYMLVDPYLSDSLTIKYAKSDKPHVRMSQRVVDPSRLNFIDVVTSSHNHTDHLDADTLGPILKTNQRIEIVAPTANIAFVAQRLGIDEKNITAIDAGQRIHTYGPAISAIPSAHPALETDDKGRYRHLGYVFDFLDNRTIYHSGDTMVYEGMAEKLRPFSIDIAILPINGKVGNMNGLDAARLAKDINARLVIPCHYDMFEFNTADPNEQFVPECHRLAQPYRVLKLGERFTYPENP